MTCTWRRTGSSGPATTRRAQVPGRRRTARLASTSTGPGGGIFAWSGTARIAPWGATATNSRSPRVSRCNEHCESRHSREVGRATVPSRADRRSGQGIRRRRSAWTCSALHHARQLVGGVFAKYADARPDSVRLRATSSTASARLATSAPVVARRSAWLRSRHWPPPGRRVSPGRRTRRSPSL